MKKASQITGGHIFKRCQQPNITLEQMPGEGDFQKPQDQAKDLQEAAHNDIVTAAKTSLLLTLDDTLHTQSFTNIKQGVTECS